MTEDRLTQALRSMEAEVTPEPTELALAKVRAESARRRRNRTAIRSVMGVAAASLAIVGGLSLIDRDDGQAVVADQSTTTTSAPDQTASTSTSTTLPPPETPPPLRDDQLDDVVGVELRTWYFDDQTESFWSADAAQVEAIVAALRDANGKPFARPDYIDHAYVRFALAGGQHALLEMDVESGWIAPDRRLPDDLTRQIREGLNEVVGHHWEELALGEDDPYLQGIIDQADPPWQSPEQAFDDLYESFALHDADARGLFGELRYGGHGPVVVIKLRGGDDSTRGVDYQFALVDGPGGWEIGGGLRRALCLRSPSFWSYDAELWSCL